MVEFKRIQLEKGIRQVGPDRWEVQVHIGRDPATGKLRQVSRTTRKGIADARRLASSADHGSLKGRWASTAGQVVPPHMPTSSPLANAASKHSVRTRQSRQNARAEMVGADQIARVKPRCRADCSNSASRS